jgi:hypothetical protein
MHRHYSELSVLTAAADDAYRVVRIAIIDTLPARAQIDETALTAHQRRVLTALTEAEANLASYRQGSYVSAS